MLKSFIWEPGKTIAAVEISIAEIENPIAAVENPIAAVENPIAAVVLERKWRGGDCARKAGCLAWCATPKA